MEDCCICKCTVPLSISDVLCKWRCLNKFYNSISGFVVNYILVNSLAHLIWLDILKIDLLHSLQNRLALILQMQYVSLAMIIIMQPIGMLCLHPVYIIVIYHPFSREIISPKQKVLPFSTDYSAAHYLKSNLVTKRHIHKSPYFKSRMNSGDKLMCLLCFAVGVVNVLEFKHN